MKPILYSKKLSLTQQWIGTTLLSMLPLIIAVTYATWEMSSQARAQKRLVMEQARISQLSATIQELSKDIERSARQHQLLQEGSLLKILKIKKNQLSDSLSEVKVLLPSLANNDVLQEINNHSEEIILISQRSNANRGQHLENLYSTLKNDSDTLHGQLRSAVQDNLDRAEDELNNVLWRVLITGLLALPASFLLLGASTIIVTRSISRLSLAIHDLGNGKWDKAIGINGPSDLVELGHRLEWMRTQLLSVEQQKAQFTQHITHELKSPLAAIIDAQGILADQIPGRVNNQQMAVLKILRNQADNLQELIQQLLNFNTISQGIAANDEEIDLHNLCKKLIARYRNLLSDASIQINYSGHDGLVTGNAQLIEMILSNLLSNAIHFCRPSGSVCVSWGVREIDNRGQAILNSNTTGSFWWLQVSDDGPGIDNDERDAIFQPFYQGRNKRHGALKGSGIGLAIVKACAEQANANLSLNSIKNKGSKFTLCFPDNG